MHSMTMLGGQGYRQTTAKHFRGESSSDELEILWFSMVEKSLKWFPPLVGASVPTSSRQTFLPRHSTANRGQGAVGEGYQKLKNRLISRGLPEMIVDPL